MGKKEFYVKFSSVNSPLLIAPSTHVNREKLTLSPVALTSGWKDVIQLQGLKPEKGIILKFIFNE
jgi:hypothetical protein